MKNRLAAPIFALALLAGCAGYSEREQRIGSGLLIGTGLGAGIGAIAGNTGAGAAIGAGVGLLGGLLADHTAR